MSTSRENPSSHRVVFAAVGGALVPVTVLPQWVQSLAQATPTYWAMQGFLATILKGEGIVDAIPGTLVLLAFTGVFASIAAAKFRFEETKVFYA